MYEELKKPQKKGSKRFGANVLIRGNICYRCEHEWRPKNIELGSRVCPKCKSPYWDRPRRKCKGNAKS